MRKLLLAVMSAAILIGLLALPAAAVDQGVAVIAGGVAEVGDDFVGGDSACTKDAQPAVTGRGIGLPQNPKGDRNMKYRLVKLGMPAVILDQDNLRPSIALGDLSICGNVGAVGGKLIPGDQDKLGPWCGMSKGYNGKGKIRFTDIVSGKDNMELKVHWAQLSDVVWKWTVAGTLPVLGKVRAQNTGPAGSKSTKKNKWGTLIALVNARSISPMVPVLGTPGPSCTAAHEPDASGQTFGVEGVAAIVGPTGAKGHVIEWKDFPDGDKDRQDSPIFCKGSYDFDNDHGVKEGNCPIYQQKPKPTKPKDN